MSDMPPTTAAAPPRDNVLIVSSFIALASRFINEIQLDIDDTTKAPHHLPGHVGRALSSVLQIKLREVRELWAEYKDLIWLRLYSMELQPTVSERLLAYDDGQVCKDNKLGTVRVVDVFKYVTDQDDILGEFMFYPPVKQCHQCQSTLKERHRYEVVLFTDGKTSLQRDAGSYPAYMTSLYCRGELKSRVLLLE